MALNKNELNELVRFLCHKIDSLSDELLDKIEIGIWIFPPLPFGSLNISGARPDTAASQEAPVLLSGNFGRENGLEILMLFRDQVIPYLLVRVESWECYINCDGDILSEHCEENLDAVREACEKLRERCKGRQPAVRK